MISNEDNRHDTSHRAIQSAGLKKMLVPLITVCLFSVPCAEKNDNRLHGVVRCSSGDSGLESGGEKGVRMSETDHKKESTAMKRSVDRAGSLKKGASEARNDASVSIGGTDRKPKGFPDKPRVDVPEVR